MAGRSPLASGHMLTPRRMVQGERVANTTHEHVLRIQEGAVEATGAGSYQTGAAGAAPAPAQVYYVFQPMQLHPAQIQDAQDQIQGVLSRGEQKEKGLEDEGGAGGTGANVAGAMSIDMQYIASLPHADSCRCSDCRARRDASGLPAALHASTPAQAPHPVPAQHAGNVVAAATAAAAAAAASAPAQAPAGSASETPVGVRRSRGSRSSSATTRLGQLRMHLVLLPLLLLLAERAPSACCITASTRIGRQ